MSTDTKAPPATPKHIARYLTNAGKTFDRILTEDDIARGCFRDYCFSLLDQLGVRLHSLLDMAGRDKPTPTADQKERLLQRFAEVVKERHGRFYDVYEEHFLSMLQRYSYEWLSQNAGYAESQELLQNAAKAIPHEVTRQWDNPVRLITHPVTGERSLRDVTSRTAMPLILGAQAFLRELEPPRKPGRPKGLQKLKQSGRATLPHDEARAVYQAIESDGKDWKYCVRKILNKRVPSDHKERERLRAYVGRLKYKGSIL